MKKVVLFDLDGTLLNTLGDLTDAINFSLKHFLFPERRESEVRLFVGNGIRNALLLALPENEKDRIDEALPVFQEYYSRNSTVKTCPYPGVLGLLDRLNEEGYLLGVVSNKKDEFVLPMIEKFFPQISLAMGERDGIRRKPAPDSLLEALSLLGAKKEECVYIGDSDVDVLCAKNAGVNCVAVTWGFRDMPVLKEAGAEHFAATAEELYERICEILK